MACIHTLREEPSLHYKRKLRPGFEDKCLTCFSYGVFARHRENRGIKPPKNPISGTHDLEQFKEGYEALGRYAEQISYPPELWPDPNSNPCVPLRPVHKDKSFSDLVIVPELVSGQFGESHHVLVSRFLLQFDNLLDDPEKIWSHCHSVYPAVEPTFSLYSKTEKSKARMDAKASLPEQQEDDDIERRKRLLREIEDLLSWYQRPGQRVRSSQSNTKEHGGTDGKGNATSIISAAFRSAYYGAPLETYRLNRPKYMGSSTHLFKYIQESLRLVTWYPYSSFPDRWSNYKHLISPSHVAKSWLHRYFRLTEQFGTVDRNDNESIADTLHKYKAMPKCDEIKRLAVVYIRRTLETGSTIGRIMGIQDDSVLKHVLASISQANKLSDQANLTERDPELKDYEIPPTRFSHVMLYGDFDYLEGLQLKREAVKYLGENVVVSFICRPWEAPPVISTTEPVKTNAPNEKEHALATRVSEFWASFRDDQIDYLPVQVKVLGIWSALAERYTPKICIIGHRSGFIEGAAMIGIPTFYLNSERFKMGITPKPSNSQTEAPMNEHEPDQVQTLISRLNEFPERIKGRLAQVRWKESITKALGELLSSKENLQKHREQVAEDDESFLKRDRKGHKKTRGSKHESTEDDEWKGLQRRKLLWDASVVKDPASDRLRELADVMDTLIPVEILTDQDPSAQKTKPTYLKTSGRPGNSRNVSTTSLPANSPRPSTDTQRVPANDRSLRLIEGCERELTAALFMYMCCARRTDPEQVSREAPGWCWRVRLMHSVPETDEEDKMTMGQSWLKSNWEYAMNSSDTKAGSSTNTTNLAWTWEKRSKQWLEIGPHPGVGGRGRRAGEPDWGLHR